MQEKNNDVNVKQKNYRPDRPDERIMQFKLGARNYLHTPSQAPIHWNHTIADSSNGIIPVNEKAVLTKCDFREGHNPESLVGYNEIKVSDLVHLWDGRNVKQPVFVKLMQRSHTSVGFFLRIPGPFCRRYLPAEDSLITLETKTGELYETKYLPRHTGLSGGWKRFAINKKLVKGDLAIFHLVEATIFKVYIIRQGCSTVKLPTPLFNLYTEARQCVVDGNQLIVYNRRKVHQLEENNKKNGKNNWKDTYQVDTDFKNIEGFKDFNTVISVSQENQHLSELRTHAYNELCHANLFKGLNPELFDIKSIISETVSIGIALRTCTPSTFLDKFSEWAKILTYNGAIGMNVSLLSARLDHLRNLAVNSDGAVNRSRYIEACRERKRCECEVKRLEMVLAKWRKFHTKLASKVKDLESKAGWEKYMEAFFSLTQAEEEIREIEDLIDDFAKFFEHYDTMIETLKLKAINHEHQFQKEAAAPW